ncbi:MAG: sensor histidine kinase [Anaerovoracaceae bacterium]
MKKHFIFNGIHFKTWLYFLVFAAILVSTIWILHSFSIGYYYESMKIEKSQKFAVKLAKKYYSEDSANFDAEIEKFCTKDNMYIDIISDDVILSHHHTYSNANFTEAVKEVQNKVKNNNLKKAYLLKKDSSLENKIYAYALMLDSSNNTILVVLTPISNTSSTIQILDDQLVYVLIIAFLLSILMAFYSSNRITKPIRKITDAAKSLADGDYSVSFSSNHQYSEIDNLASTLEIASEKLYIVQNMQRDLIANVSHDLRTPLTMIKSYAEMIKDLSGDSPKKRNQHLNVIIQETDRLNSLVGDLLTISSAQSGKLQMNVETINLSELVNSVLKMYKIYELNKNYKFSINIDNSLQIIGDRKRLMQATNNLISNAIKYCGEDKNIIINIHKNGDYARLEVIDNGIGISADEIPSLWDRYYQASTNHARGASGTGLGLAIVKEILILHNAKFGVDSKVGEGSTFWFELPIES